MKVVKNTKSESKKRNSDFYDLKIHKNKVQGESKLAIMVAYGIKDDKGNITKTNFVGISKKLVYTSEYSNIISVSYPKSFELKYQNSLGETILCDNIKEFCDAFNIYNKE